ncbi:PIG-L deacetylase family protein [Paracoccus laeviglucosivorans]|uniref:N-acetylglucosaminyl deacetylase, LmbE family n=1 Tax=Paracoccus laeviglucosivorans TaxID=1197861 RepID=A0A521FQ58_9RHOB|nr:PIG-L deacetylase family protein [Paracoccus laeviglucosivorans]SMO98322.1 N-acetylglucosaminyl deacetylase, LmbE family [Paracoccus laeviglucosivorans]
MSLQSYDHFTPVTATRLLAGRTTLVVLAPHPDDEVLGCGALLAQAAAQGVYCRVICVTDGRLSHPASRLYPAPRLISLRQAELRAALDCLGSIWLEMLGYPDCQAPSYGPAVARIAALVPNGALLLATWAGDPHVDHQSCAALAGAVAARRPDLMQLAYPIWGRVKPALPFPTTGWRLRDGHPAKPAALACHASQMTGLIPDDPDGFVMAAELQQMFLTQPEIFLAA